MKNLKIWNFQNLKKIIKKLIQKIQIELIHLSKITF